MNSWRLDGARAVVTGGTRGIGLAVVAQLLELGASVVTAGRELDDVDPRLIAAREAGRVHLVAADLARAEGRAALLDALPAGWDTLDVLVNNVGTNIRKPSLAVTDDDYRHIVDTNMTCAWDLARALHPRLAASGRGAIVNVGSVAGQVSVGTGAVYAMTKAAIEQLTRYLAVEWAKRWHPRQRSRAVVHPDAARRARARRSRHARAPALAHADGPRRRARRDRGSRRLPLAAGRVLRHRPDRGR